MASFTPLISLRSEPLAGTLAAQKARANFRANLQPLRTVQPEMASLLETQTLDINWTFARDGCLSAIDAAGRWHSNCSLPFRVARQLLKKLNSRAPVSCFLSPSHPAQIAVALEILQPQQALIVILPDDAALGFAIHGQDFSSDISASRLFFAFGANWRDELTRLFHTHTGLPTPQVFIRTPLLADAESQSLIAAVEPLVAAEHHRRQELISALLKSSSAQRTGRGTTRAAPLIIAPSRFRLWHHAAQVIGSMLPAVRRLDPDHPAESSALALVEAASNAQAVFTANLSRHDLPGVIPDGTSLITWVTSPRIPPFSRQYSNDVLLLADPQLAAVAQASSWPESQLRVATWPAPVLTAPIKPAHLAILADTSLIPQTPPGFDYSSHQLLWEFIQSEIGQNPFAFTDDVAGYLPARLRKLSISSHSFDHAIFLEKLILPACQQSLARMLLNANVPLRIFGQGWRNIPEFAAHSAGPIENYEQLLAAASGATGLVHLAPQSATHPMLSFPRPILRPSDRDSFVRTARQIISHAPPPGRAPTPALSAALLATLSGESILRS